MIFRIIVRHIPVIVFFISISSFGQDQKQLKVADSLFNEGKYTEALALYNSLFEAGYASPATLLKMAYVADAQNDHSNALYYLDLYYQKSGDRLAVGKIEELADANDLFGYTYTDTDYLIAIFAKYSTQVLALTLGVFLLLFVYCFRKIKRKERPYAGLVIQSFFAVLLLFLVNFKTQDKAIIIADHALLKAGPSAGAEAIQVIAKGHRVTVLNYSEIWSKIIWEGDEVFIRTSRLKSI